MTGLKKRRVFLSTALSCMCLTLVACGKGGQTETLYENGRMESFLEESSSLAGEANGITVLHTAAAEAVPDLSGSENFRVIPVAPGKMEASLSGLTL